MTTENRHCGTLRTDYEADLTKSDKLQPLTTDTDILLNGLIRESRKLYSHNNDCKENRLASLLENHVLTVLADIRRKRLDGYSNSFANAKGTSVQTDYTVKLANDVKRWVDRLDIYIRNSLAMGSSDSQAFKIAYKVCGSLSNALKETDIKDSRSYYRLLRTVSAVQENATQYMRLAEDSCNTEPAIAMILACLKNYATVAGDFNKRFAALPELYRREVLHAEPAETVPDNVYIAVTPSGKGFTLNNGTAFDTGDELVYSNPEKEYISTVRCVKADAVCLPQVPGKMAYIQPLHFEDLSDAETLFSGGYSLQTGWQIESPVLVMEEGKRDVEVCFVLEKDVPGNDIRHGFCVEYSTAEGWEKTGVSCRLCGNELVFRINIARNEHAPAPCNTEIHRTETVFPTLRILSALDEYPVWARNLKFGSVRITVAVSGIRDFSFINELGEADTTQPLSPFGIQAEYNSWFIFGNRETGMKPLKKVELTGIWQKLPETKTGFNNLYNDYPGTDASAFCVTTSYLKDGNWIACRESKPLLEFDDNGHLKPAKLVFDFNQNNSTPGNNLDGSYAYTHSKDGLFRVTLAGPAIGFGVNAYRKRFSEVMMHNSHCKQKELWDLPQEPNVPILTDIEMAYAAETVLTLNSLSVSDDSDIVISPVLMADGMDTPPREGLGRILPLCPAENMLYFAFAGAAEEKKIRMYLDLVLPQDKLPFYNPDLNVHVRLKWQYWNTTDWMDIAETDIAADETAGLTQSGFVEICFRHGIRKDWLDSKERLWLRAALPEDISACLALRSVWTNFIRITADNGNGSPLPAGTILGSLESDERIDTVCQPFNGFGGITAATETQYASHQKARFSNRHRAVTPRDYEQIILEHFPEIDMAQCLNVTGIQGKKNSGNVYIVVFSRKEDNRFFLLSPWKLKEMERTLSLYSPACARPRVMNPVYEKLTVMFHATLHFGVEDTEKVLTDLTAITDNYFMPWRKRGYFPVPGQTFSAKELFARIVNHEDLQRITSMVINGKEIMVSVNGWDESEDIIRGKEAWSILLPEVEFVLAAPDDGVGGNGISNDFVVG